MASGPPSAGHLGLEPQNHGEGGCWSSNHSSAELARILRGSHNTDTGPSHQALSFHFLLVPNILLQKIPNTEKSRMNHGEHVYTCLAVSTTDAPLHLSSLRLPTHPSICPPFFIFLHSDACQSNWQRSRTSPLHSSGRALLFFLSFDSKVIHEDILFVKEETRYRNLNLPSSAPASVRSSAWG